MTARCQLCGITVTSSFNAKDATEPELLMEYDNLSWCMWLHIIENHATQALEGKANQARAARMYAMNWADHDRTMLLLKQEWRQRMLIAMTVTTRAEHETPERYAADAAAADPAGLNAKKSARNKSN
jgi:hypothetical protein